MTQERNIASNSPHTENLLAPSPCTHIHPTLNAQHPKNDPQSSSPRPHPDHPHHIYNPSFPTSNPPSGASTRHAHNQQRLISNTYCSSPPKSFRPTTRCTFPPTSGRCIDPHAKFPVRQTSQPTIELRGDKSLGLKPSSSERRRGGEAEDLQVSVSGSGLR